MSQRGPYLAFQSNYDRKRRCFVRPEFIIGVEPTSDDQTIIHLEGGETITVQGDPEDVISSALKALGLES